MPDFAYSVNREGPPATRTAQLAIGFSGALFLASTRKRLVSQTGTPLRLQPRPRFSDRHPRFTWAAIHLPLLIFGALVLHTVGGATS